MEKNHTAKRPFSHPLYGSNLLNLIDLKKKYGAPSSKYRIQWWTALLLSAIRSPFTLLEKIYTQNKIDTLNEIDPPIFIVGHWRSGTTHLSNILSKSPQFGYVSPIAAGLPWNILLLGKWFRPLLEQSLPADRLIDRVKVKPDSPQEDAFGIANMQTVSFAHGFYFTGSFDQAFNKGVFLEECTDEERNIWEKMHRYYLHKLYIDQDYKKLIIRNPAYSTRITRLKQIWPGAKFIHIVRDPYRVFRSMRNFYEKLLPALALQPYDHLDIDEIILSTYEKMMGMIIESASKMPDNEFIEIKYESLDAQPLETIELIYNRFGLQSYTSDQSHFADYLESIKRYKKNIFPDDDKIRNLVNERWDRFLEHWNYIAD